MSGLDVVQAIGPAEMPATIFVTAYDQYALHAFDSAAVDYLVKPFKDDRFEEALRRARRRIESESRERLHEQLMALLQGGSARRARAVTRPRRDRRSRRRSTSSASRCRCAGRCGSCPSRRSTTSRRAGSTWSFTSGRTGTSSASRMQHLEERLDPEQFVRVHRSAIVRLSLVDTLLRSEGSDYQVQLKGGVRLPVGRSRREALERRLGRTW